MVGKFAECTNADALRRTAERSQSMIDAQRAEEEQSKEREAEDRRKASLQVKMDQRCAREDAAVAKAKEKAVAERMARQEALPVNVKVSNQQKDMQEWQERRARARKRDIRSSSNK